VLIVPNGRSGGFPLAKAELRRFVTATAQTAVVGHVVADSTYPKPSTAAEFAALVDQCQLHDVAVEEQDRDYYVIHLSNRPILWLMVGSESVLFAPLRECHSRWKSEHPDWKGWLAF
jgi:hypothetical protein